jgi:hypothetical protein
MPNICSFAGIVITMYADEHYPPHFHAKYGEFNALFTLDGNLIEGDLPSKKRRMVEVWAELRYEQLLENWKLCQENRKPNKLQPLS